MSCGVWSMWWGVQVEEFLRREVIRSLLRESKYGHKIRKVSSTSIKIVRKVVQIFKGEMFRTGIHCR